MTMVKTFSLGLLLSSATLFSQSPITPPLPAPGSQAAPQVTSPLTPTVPAAAVQPATGLQPLAGAQPGVGQPAPPGVDPTSSFGLAAGATPGSALTPGATPATVAPALALPSPSRANAGKTIVPAPTLPAAIPQVAPNYLIGPSDDIQVIVWREPGLSGALSVRPDGMISLPLLGDVPASGSTPVQLAQDLTGRLKKYINDPTVTVTVTAVNSKRIYMLGEIAHIGALPLGPGMTVLQAIATAGGLSPYANAKHIYILRDAQGKQQKLFFDYKKAVKDGNLQGISLQPGDTIVVP